MSAGTGRRVGTTALWAALAIVLAVALAVGAWRGGPQTPAQRAAALDSIIKCPSCDGISVADSSASTAAAVRQLVLARVRQGQSDQQIEQYLVSRYGPSILLRPPTTGITAVVWVVPLVAAVGGLGGLGFFFWRRRRPPAASVSVADRALVDRARADRGRGDHLVAGAAVTETRQELEDERSFLLRSLEDLDREHEVGDLSDQDHATLRDGYIARTAQVLKALDGGSPAPAEALAAGPAVATASPPALATTPKWHRRRGRWLALAVLAVIGVAVWAVVAHVGPRLPGESVTGSVTLTPSQQTARALDQAETLESQGDAADAVKLYGTVLQRDPNQEQALAELGWLEYEAGAEAKKATLLSLGEAEEQRAEQVDPGDYAPHLYLGSMLLAQGDSAGAVVQYRDFLADHPPRAKVTAAVPFIVQAFSEAHQTPPALPVGPAAKS